jgi:hypothetical protein
MISQASLTLLDALIEMTSLVIALLTLIQRSFEADPSVALTRAKDIGDLSKRGIEG